MEGLVLLVPIGEFPLVLYGNVGVGVDATAGLGVVGVTVGIAEPAGGVNIETTLAGSVEGSGARAGSAKSAASAAGVSMNALACAAASPSAASSFAASD
jgi:hypothetical protein